MAYTFSQGYMRGEGDPNLDTQINAGGNKIPKLYIDDLTDSFYSFNDTPALGFKWTYLIAGFVTKVTNLKVLLQGPATGSVMTSALSTANLIPLNEPYAALGYNRVGFKDEVVANLGVLSNNTITDWVLVELRDRFNPEIVRYNKAALLKNNGEIFEVDGVTKLTFTNIRDEQYYIAIKHRNHIGLMTPNAVNIATTLDFTTAATSVFGVDNRKDNSGLLRLRAGKTDPIGYGSMTGVDGWSQKALKTLNYNSATILTSVYNLYDVNLNGTFRYAGLANDNGVVLTSFDNNIDNKYNEQIPPLVPLALNSLVTNAIGNQLQKGTTAQRSVANIGTIRFNTDSSKVEFFNGTVWEIITSLAAGTNYISVPNDNTPILNGTAFRAAYTAAQGMSPTASKRITLVVSPGEIALTASFTMATAFIDIVSLTNEADVIFTGGNFFIVGVNNVKVVGINTGTNAFTIDASYVNNVYTNCVGGQFSFGYAVTSSGTFNNCIGGSSSFGAEATASGTFNNCIGGYASFGSDGNASGTFNNCIGGGYTFGATGTASGTFNNCVGEEDSFGSDGNASGTFNNCISGINSFGSVNGLTGRLFYCRLTPGSGTFQTVSGGGRTYYCIDGNGAVNNQ